MSEKMMAASRSKRRIGCRVTSTASSGVLHIPESCVISLYPDTPPDISGLPHQPDGCAVHILFAACFHLLMEKLTDMVIKYLNAQISHGAQAVQVFDSWVGCLSATDYKTFVLPHMKRLFASLDPGAPHIHFALGASHMLKLVSSAGGDVIGVDWRTPLNEAWKKLGLEKAIQGNLDPALLFGSKEHLAMGVIDILERAGNRNGHIFNLGHGIFPPRQLITSLYS